MDKETTEEEKWLEEWNKLSKWYYAAYKKWIYAAKT